MPEISIIVPNYNTEKYLPRCLESLIHQTFKDIEIILIDDGSKDKSVDIIKKYAEKDSRIRLIKQQNAGPAKARNQGLECAAGKYLMFCDSDDWYETNMCQIMYDTIQKQKVDVVCCHNFFDWEENLSGNEKEKRLIKKYYNLNRYGKYPLNEKNILSTNVVLWNKIWRRDLIEQYCIRFPEGHEHDDDAFWYMYAFVANSIFYLKKTLYHYFLRAGSIMSTQVNKKPKNRMDRVAVSEYVLNFLLKNKLQEKTNLMVRIYRGQLSGCRKFFNEDELTKMCSDITKKLQEKLQTTQFIFCDKGHIYINKNKKLWQLCLEFLYYHPCFVFWHLCQNKEKVKRYNRKILKNHTNFQRWMHE